MDFTEWLDKRNPGEREFTQAVLEVWDSVKGLVEANADYRSQRIFERLTEPDRIITFRVAWEDDKGQVHVNRGYRIQHCNAIGPYKGGLRFHPSVNQSILKFLAFEQTFKNSLTGLPMGGGKGGSDFDPKGKSDREIMRFCQAFMNELYRHIGPNIDVPAGDIGVGSKEVGYLFGQYKRLTTRFEGTLTGKQLEIGGSHIRTEATGYGLVYFLAAMLRHHKVSLKGKSVAISGSGNVAQYAAEKCMHLGMKVITLSDSGGTVSFEKGLSLKDLEAVRALKHKRGRLKELAESKKWRFLEARPWKVRADIALPCATENEVGEDDARSLVAGKVIAVAEGANMPCTPQAIKVLRSAGVLYAPGKASNAGGVAVSGLEMSQNSLRLSWDFEEMDKRLREIMLGIHDKCVKHGGKGKRVDYMDGANIAGFRKVADAMLAKGIM